MKLGSSVKTTSLLWLAPQKHRDMLRSLTAGLVVSAGMLGAIMNANNRFIYFTYGQTLTPVRVGIFTDPERDKKILINVLNKT